MASDLTVLQAFVPGQLVDWLEREPSLPLEPASSERQMVSWFADLSNFSHLTYEITRRDRSGPELVGHLLNEIFGAIVETVQRHGGQVLDFAGDSVLGTWLIEKEGDVDLSLARAAQCGLEAVRLAFPKVYAESAPLDLRVGVGAGTGVLIQTGGVDDQWHFVIGGAPFDQIGRAGAVARPGEVVMSPEAARLAGPAIRGGPDSSGFVRVTAVDETEPLVASPRPVSQAWEDRIRQFVPPPVLARIDAGQSEWLSEFRQVTSVFVNLPEFDVSTKVGRDALQDVVTTTQTTLGRFEGTLTRILDDDKGITMLSSFGLPPFAHEEDAYLAVQAAEEIATAIAGMRIRYGIGIATGRTFCGAYGSPDRRDFTTLGREVNLAARLMQAARSEILCDRATQRAARRVEFLHVGDRSIRGWDEPVEVYKPLWESPTRIEAQPAELFGRETEQTQLTGWLGALAQAHSSGVVLIEGEPGIGKSTLAADLMKTAGSFDIRMLQGTALPVAQAPYQAWRDVLSDVLEISDVRSLERRQNMVRERLSTWPQLAQWEALLNSVLDLDFPENALTRGMSGRSRGESTVELIVTLMADAATQTPLLVVLDDLHWFDSASWAVTLAVARKVSPLLLVLLTRPMPEPPEQLDELLDVGNSARLTLRPIGRQDAIRLAADRLGAREVSPEVVDLILQTAEGVPLFIEELALSLRDTDVLEIRNGVARLARSTVPVVVPQSLRSVVLNRIDRLDPAKQLTLKVASVIGRSFDLDELEAVHPAHPGVEELSREIAVLEGLDLIVESFPKSYDFRHLLTRETAYDLLLFDQRERIHQDVAAYLESRADAPQELYYGLLAYHWDRGGDAVKAVDYFEKSGASALRKGANQEAIAAHSRSLELVAAYPGAFAHIGDLRQSQWRFEIAQAHEAMGEFAEAEGTLYQALDQLGVTVPVDPLPRLMRAIWEAVKQVVHISMPWAIRIAGDEEERKRLAQAARIAALLGEVYYFTGNVTGFPAVNLLAINLGERSGEPVVSGLAYSSTGYLAGTLRMRRLADRYFARARTAEHYETVTDMSPMTHLLDFAEMRSSHLIAVDLAESVLALTFDEWGRARRLANDGLKRCEQLGDMYSAGIALAVRGFVSYSSGEIHEAQRDYMQLLASARQRGNREHEGWATSFVVPVLLALDRLDEAQTMSAAATGIIESVDPLTVPIIEGMRSQVQLRTGQDSEALASAERALEAIESTPFFIYLAGYAGLMDTLLELWAKERDSSLGHSERLARAAKTGLNKLGRFARVLPFARPKYWLYRGRVEALQGKISRAKRSLNKGLTLAKNSGFTWDEGLLHLELARILADRTERDLHITAARWNLGEVGSLHDLARLEAMASGGSRSGSG